MDEGGDEQEREAKRNAAVTREAGCYAGYHLSKRSNCRSGGRDVAIVGKAFRYGLAVEFPDGFQELRVLEKTLTVNEHKLFTRDKAQVTLRKENSGNESRFSMDWHVVALPMIQEPSQDDPIAVFRTWLARILILAPIPSLIDGNSDGEKLFPNRQGLNTGAHVGPRRLGLTCAILRSL